MYEDSPEDTVHDENISFALRGIQSNSISGTPEGLKKITREHFMKYLRDQYVASNLTIVISGNFDEELLMRQLEEKCPLFQVRPRRETMTIAMKFIQEHRLSRETPNRFISVSILEGLTYIILRNMPLLF